MNCWPQFACACLVLSSCSSDAQSSSANEAVFSGRNVYSPSLRYDGARHIFQMWYGGWQADADYPHDKIYYRQSADGIGWSAPQAVLSPSQLPVSASHVNDPSVVALANPATKRMQYTMFYTVCLEPCSRSSDNQLWSSVSTDGVHWGRAKPLIETGGASEPSAVPANGAGGAVWRVYYSNTSEAGDTPRHIYMAEVDGSGAVVSKDAVVYTYPGAGVIANPEVREVRGTWFLLFNVYHTRPGAKRTTADIYVAQSATPTQWESGAERPLVVNDPEGETCASVAPGLLDHDGRLLLQFGEARYEPSGACDFSQFRTMRQIDVPTGWLSNVANGR